MGARRGFKGFTMALALAVLPCFRLGGVAGPESVAFADTSAREICIQSVTGGAGATVSVPLQLHDSSGVASFQVDVQYDASLMTPSGAHLGTDTAAAGGWAVDAQIVSEGLYRVLGYSTLAVGLGSGTRQVAVIDFLIGSGGAAGDNPLPLTGCVLGDPTAQPLPCAACVQPGVTGAEPRFAVSVVDDALGFMANLQIVEQGDWVLWKNLGSSLSHTATSGPACAPDGIWDGTLTPALQLARRFLEPPGTFPYFCRAHCAQGETGEVVVTPPILLSAGENAGGLLLTWSGGSGLYRVFRSNNPGFTGAATQSFTPDAGAAGVSFTDAAQPDPGRALFYLVINKN